MFSSSIVFVIASLMVTNFVWARLNRLFLALTL